MFNIDKIIKISYGSILDLEILNEEKSQLDDLVAYCDSEKEDFERFKNICLGNNVNYNEEVDENNYEEIYQKTRITILNRLSN